MKRKREAGQLDRMQLVEEAVHLLRSAPARAWAAYLCGAVPYGVGLIWFYLETTRSAYALESLVWTSGAMTGLFLSKQISESLFLASLREAIAEAPPGRQAIGRFLVRQAAMQPTSLLGLPLALLATLPLPYALSFYRQFSLSAMDGSPGAIGRAWNCARYATGPMWALLGVLGLGALLLYGNLLAAVMVVAMLANSLFGVETLATNPGALFRNPAVHLAIGAAVYFAVDLMLDAAAVLQWFYARSIRSGDDILAGLRRASAIAAVAGLLIAVAPASAQSGPDAAALDSAIDRTLRQSEFAWRTVSPRDDAPPFVRGVLEALRKAGRVFADIVETVLRWLDELGPSPAGGAGRGGGGGGSVRYWMAGLGVLALAFLVALAFRLRKRQKRAPVEASAVAQPVDVRDEAVVATALAEDEWLRMADEHLAHGEFRVALRALHLACLRLLSERGLVTVARWKTGMEYLDEVGRRSRGAGTEVAPRFRENLGLFELGWYSRHTVEAPMVAAYREGLEEIRRAGGLIGAGR